MIKIVRGIILGIAVLIFICFLISIILGYPLSTIKLEAVCLVSGIVGAVIMYKLTKGESDEEDRDYPRRF